MSGREKRHLLFLVLFALSLRLYVSFVTPVVGTDDYTWFRNARCFAEGNFVELLSGHGHPLYPLLYGGLVRLIGDYEIAGKAVAIVFGTLCILPIYFVSRSIFSHKVGIFASFLSAINPSHVRLSADIMPDTTQIFFFLTSIWLGWEIIKKKKNILVIFLALSISLAYLTSVEGIGLVVCIVPWLIWSWLNLRENRLYFKRILTAALLIGLVVAVPLLSAYYLNLLSGKSSLSLGVLRVSLDKLSVHTESNRPLPQVYTEIDEDTGRVREPAASRLSRWKQGGEYHKVALFVFHKFIKLYYEPLFLFFLVGFFRLTRPEKINLKNITKILRPRFASQVYTGELYLLTPLLLYFPLACVYAYQHYLLSGRYILYIVILSFVWGGAGIEKVSQYLTQFKSYFQRKTLGFETSHLFLLLIILAITLPKDLKIKRKDEVIKKEAGYWIKANSPTKNPFIIGLGEQELEKVAFYAEGEFWQLHPKDFKISDLLANVKIPTYIVFYREEITNDTFCLIEKNKRFAFMREWIYNGKGKEKHLKLYSVRDAVSKAHGNQGKYYEQ